jgi:hypothetical protein
VTRFIVVRGLTEVVSNSETANWLVVDTNTSVVFADCGDHQARANTVAAALNEYVT